MRGLVTRNALPLATAAVAFTSAAVAQDTLTYGPQFGGEFKVLTGDIFPSSEHHLTNKLAFPEVYESKRRLSADHGLDWALLTAPVYQFGTGADTDYLDNEVDLMISWRLLENEGSTGRIFFYGLWVETLSDLPSGAFARSQGVFTLPNSGGTDPGKTFVTPAALWWEQNFEDTGLRYRIGQLWATNLWGTNDYYGDDRATYMNSVMGGGSGVPWIGGNRGLGAMVSLEYERGYVSLGFQDSKADQQKIDFDSFGDGNFSYLAEAGLHTSLGADLRGTYKLTLGYIDDNGGTGQDALPAGYGVNLSGQQRVSNSYAVYGFYRRSWERFAANVEQSAAFGVTALEPFGWKDDNLSLAAFYAKPADTKGGALRDEFGLETFWRFQLTPRLDMTPSAIIYLRPGQVEQNDPVAVFGLRLRYVL